LLAGFVKKRKYARAEAPKLLLPIMQSANQQRKAYDSEMFTARVVDYAAHLCVLGWERDAVDLPDEAGLSGADAAWLRAEVARQPFVRARTLLPEGFFPTPPALVEELLRHAQPLHKGMRVLEPSAGNGAIARALRAAGVEPKLVELNDDLRAILVTDGFQLVGDDFLKFDQQGWDRILMNPPFERGQDMEHVRHAYDLLADGGILAAITSEGPFFREDRKAAAFRDWLKSVGGSSHKNVEGAFKGAERSTGVQTRIVVIRK
jgi:methylase of polypeptide subunit release factors